MRNCKACGYPLIPGRTFGYDWCNEKCHAASEHREVTTPVQPAASNCLSIETSRELLVYRHWTNGSEVLGELLKQSETHGWATVSHEDLVLLSAGFNAACIGKVRDNCACVVCERLRADGHPVMSGGAQ